MTDMADAGMRPQRPRRRSGIFIVAALVATSVSLAVVATWSNRQNANEITFLERLARARGDRLDEIENQFAKLVMDTHKGTLRCYVFNEQDPYGTSTGWKDFKNPDIDHMPEPTRTMIREAYANNNCTAAYASTHGD